MPQRFVVGYFGRKDERCERSEKLTYQANKRCGKTPYDEEYFGEKAV